MRGVVIGVCALVVAVLFAAIVRQSWSDTSAAADIVRAEQDGAATLHPMVTLLSELVEAQSSAVRGETVDVDKVRGAVKALTDANSLYGGNLQTTQRLADLNSQLESAFAKGPRGRDAYETYTPLVDLAIQMFRRIGDTSHLIHDPDLDSYYLMDAAIIRLPDAIVYAGRATDLVTLAGGKALAGEDQVRAAVARFTVSADAESVSSGLTKSVASTTRSELGTNIADRLDTFKSATDDFAPPTMLAELSNLIDATALAASARRVYAAATSLAHRLLNELQALLQVRTAKLDAERRLTAIATAAAAIVGLIMLWFAIAGRPRRSPGRAFGAPEDTGVGSLAYARELLDSGELTPAGRGSARGNGNAL
jgi:hypothetical protein